MSIESSLQFTETMRGFFSENKNSLSFSQLTDQFSSCYDLGKNLNYPLDFTLTIKIQSIDAFCNDPDLQANAEGVIQCPRLGGELAVKKGLFNLFVRPSSSIEFNAAKEMHYLLHFLDKNGEQKTFFGFKVVDREDFVDIWPETTTLYTCIFDGFLSTAPQKNQIPSFVGILKIEVKDFIQQLQSFKTNQKDLSSRASVLAKFLSLFAGNLWEAYAPFIFGTEEQRWDEHIIALQSNEGVRGVEIQKRNVFTKDGLFLSMDRFHKKKSKNVVVLLHGLTTSTDMFIMPEHYNLVQYLLDHGYDDVWSLDWRGSSRHVYNLKPLHHTIDDVVLYDIPAALEHIKNEVGEDSSLHVICHCVGSISFMCALAAGKVSGVHSIISNSVSLTPQIRWQSKIKLSIGPNLLEYVFGYPYISPEIPFFPGPGFGRWIWWMERLLRRECKEPACHMISFMWGWGFPAAYEHDNLNVVTHRRLKDLFGGTNLHWYRHILKMVKNGQALPYDRKFEKAQLPEEYLNNIKNVQVPPLLLVSGDKNKIFPGANKITHERLSHEFSLENTEYQEFKGYGHQDILMGKRCSNEVFPYFVKFLNEHKRS